MEQATPSRTRESFAQDKERITRAFRSMFPIHQAILYAKRVDNVTFADISSLMGVSKERARQIEFRAIRTFSHRLRQNNVDYFPLQPWELIRDADPHDGDWSRSILTRYQELKVQMAVQMFEQRRREIENRKAEMKLELEKAKQDRRKAREERRTRMEMEDAAQKLKNMELRIQNLRGSLGFFDAKGQSLGQRIVEIRQWIRNNRTEIRRTRQRIKEIERESAEIRKRVAAYDERLLRP